MAATVLLLFLSAVIVMVACGGEQTAPVADPPVPVGPTAVAAPSATVSATAELQPTATVPPADTPTPTQTPARTGDPEQTAPVADPPVPVGPTAVAAPSATVSATAEPQPTATVSPADTPTPTQTPARTADPEQTATPTPTATPLRKPTPTPTATPLPEPTPAPTAIPQPTQSAAPVGKSKAIITLEGLPWYQDGRSSNEITAVRELKRIDSIEPSVAEALLGMPWIAPALSLTELEAIIYFSLMATYDPTIAERAIDLPWLRDGISAETAVALQVVGRLSTISPAVTHGIMDLPWFVDGLREDELLAIQGIVILAGQEYAEQEFPLSLHVLGLPWVVDGVTDEESEKLAFLEYLPLAVIDYENREYQKAEFETLDAILSLDPANDTLDKGVFLAFRELNPARLYGRGWDLEVYLPSGLLAEQPWFRDGLNDEEKALIISFRSILPSGRIDEATRILKQLIEHGRVHSETISSPSAGELNVYVVSRGLIPPGQDIFGKLRSQFLSDGQPVRDPSRVSHSIILVDPELRTCFPTIQIGAVIDEQVSESEVALAAFGDALEEFRSDLTASIQTVYPGEIFEEYGAVPAAEAFAPLGDTLQWAALYDNVTQRWVVFDPSGTFSVESLPLPAKVPIPDWSTVGEITHLIPNLLYWVNVNHDESVELGGVNRPLARGINPVIW